MFSACIVFPYFSPLIIFINPVRNKMVKAHTFYQHNNYSYIEYLCSNSLTNRVAARPAIFADQRTAEAKRPGYEVGQDRFLQKGVILY